MESEVHRTRMVYVGLSGVNPSIAKEVYAAYKDFMDAFMPFSKNVRSMNEDKMREIMRRETEKGAIHFNVHNPLKNTASKLRKLDPDTKKVYSRKGKF